ncbi:MAG: glycerol-3-phosphate 1-O-acyltransferase PlsY [Candidatus Anammoxibacter sp.]
MTIIFPIIAYLIGSVPFGYILVKTVKGIDIREHGSENVGATNVWRVAGRPFGIGAFVFDMLKGFVPVLVVYKMTPGKNSLAIICGIAVILGHIFPLFLRFKGGKAAATGCGVFLVLAPLALLIAMAVWALTVYISKFVSLGTILASITLAVATVLVGQSPFGEGLYLTIFTIVMSVAIIVLHRSNIKRIINGTENRIKGKKQNESIC